VRQMASLRKVHAKEHIPGRQQRKEDSLVGSRTRVGLDVCILRIEQLLQTE
jgi:hypothetical protein